MKESWDSLCDDVQNLKEQLEELLEMVPQSAKFHQKTNAINKVWKRLQKGVNDVDQFITPVKSIKVVSPLLEDGDFKQAWQLWKDYLNEQWGIVMRSRAELMGLKRMADIAEEKPALAIKYLEFAMSRMDRNFYKVNETEMPKDSEKTNGKTVIKLPANYVRTPAGVPSGGGATVNQEKPVMKVKQKTIEEEIEEFKASKAKSRKAGISRR